MPRIHFLVVDKRVSPLNVELLSDTLEHVKALISDFMVLKLSLKGSDISDLLSVISCGTEKPEVILMPQRIVSMKEVLTTTTRIAAPVIVDALMPNGPDVLSSAMEQAVPFLEAAKKRQLASAKAERVDVRMSVLVTDLSLVPLRSERFQGVLARLFDEHAVAIEFIYIESPFLTPAMPLATDKTALPSFSNFMQVIRETENCSLVKLSFADEWCFKRLLRHWLQGWTPVGTAEIIAGPLRIPCAVKRQVFEEIDLKPVEVCKCHHERVNAQPGTFCSISRSRITPDAVSTALQLGSSILPGSVSLPPPSTGPAELRVIHRVPLNSISSDVFLAAGPLLLVPHDEIAIAEDDEDQVSMQRSLLGALISRLCDEHSILIAMLDRPTAASVLPRYFALLPDTEKRGALLARPVAVCENYFPVLTERIDIIPKAQAAVDEAMKAVPEVDSFSPMHLSNNLFQRVLSAVHTQKQPVLAKPSAAPSKAVPPAAAKFNIPSQKQTAPAAESANKRKKT